MLPKILLSHHSICVKLGIEQARQLNPIDDIFFNKMGESAEVCEEIISAILQYPVKVLRVIPQNTIASLQGRGVRLDALADAMPVIEAEAELLTDCPRNT